MPEEDPHEFFQSGQGGGERGVPDLEDKGVLQRQRLGIQDQVQRPLKAGGVPAVHRKPDRVIHPLLIYYHQFGLRAGC